jgi:transposase InsO family protein
MEERVQFVVAASSGLFRITELCDLYGISRKTGYKWLGRYDPEDLSTLADQSRAPLSCPHVMPDDVREELLKTRKAHHFWGARKVRARVAEQRPDLAERLPAASTVGDLLRRSGLVEPRRRRSRAAHPESSPLVAEVPNDVWCVDFKGEFRTQDRVLCYPLTATDACTRFLLMCKGLPSTRHEGARAAFERLFAEVGLPVAIRSDNGGPFCSHAIGGLSRLSVWWMRLGIRHDRIRPASPQENSRHERMHRTLKAETTRPPAANAVAQQRVFDDFRHEFNWVRPHEALGQRTPGSLWTPSVRALPARLPAPEYPGHMKVRSVRCSGAIKFAGSLVFVSEVLAHERVAIEEIEDGVWHLHFCNTLLASLDQRTMRLVPSMPILPKTQRSPKATPGDVAGRATGLDA